MPQKRNPYALSIIRGASGTLIGRVSGFLAVVKSPSARSDNLIYAYGEVPRALDLALRIDAADRPAWCARCTVNAARMAAALESGLLAGDRPGRVRDADLRRRLPHRVRGGRRGGARGRGRRAARGVDVDRGAARRGGGGADRPRRWGWPSGDLTEVLDPRRIVATRTRGGRRGAAGASRAWPRRARRTATEFAGARARAAVGLPRGPSRAGRAGHATRRAEGAGP